MALRTNSKRSHKRIGLAARIAAAAVLFAGAGAAVAADPLVSQTPLSAGGVVPSNVLLTPSVEFPTVNSKANLGSYSTAKLYYGYFDPQKCYTYHYEATEANRYFEPSSTTGGPAVCSGKWSGNWLNWATTQTIDGFRKALTGGLRSVDTSTVTILEKARHDGQGGVGYYPNQTITDDATIAGAIPVPAASPWGTLTSRVWGGGNQLFLTGTAENSQICSANSVNTLGVGYPGPVNSSGTQAPATPYVVDYDPASHTFNTSNISPATNFDCNSSSSTNYKAITNANRIYRISVRVKVCVSGMLEDNCVAYGGNYKPEGLIQKYEHKMRFSVFGYLVDNKAYRDGGVLRANQKYVGPERLSSSTGLWEDNPNKEWDPETGVFYDNPNPDDVTATNAYGSLGAYPVHNSGVINYINKFAQSEGIFAKSFDPVSELYYTATRYLRKLEPIDAYNTLSKVMDNNSGGSTLASASDRWKLTDDFPVITDWEDPFQFWCQNTAIIGIGDVYTHKDKNLAGRERSENEPASIGDAASDPDFSGDGKHDVPWWTKKAYTIEGVSYTMPLDSGLNSSSYLVGLAYYAHTQDLRTDLGPNGEKQFASTHWVDVRERQKTEPRVRNQYWMATKYGGFLMPEDYDSETNTDTLPESWWASSESITSNGVSTETFKRATNYYLGDAPDKMIAGLTRAFAKFGSEGKGSGASLAANSTRLDTTTLTFQAQFQNSIWQGQLNAYSVDKETGALAATPLWTAGANMPAYDDRKLYVNARSSGSDDYEEFEWDQLSSEQQDALKPDWVLPSGADVDGEDVLEYIRGNQAKEESEENGALRTRSPPSGWSAALGDIVNSTPVFVGSPNAALYANSPGTWDGKTTHDDFATNNAGRTPVVWVGSNDGILHAFDASIDADGTTTATSGDEVYGFIPNKAIMSGLRDFASPNYSHKYFMDGDIAVADVYEEGASYNAGTWKTVLVGTMGRGGPGVFALDVTDPTADQVKFLWEKDESDIPALGHNIGRPVIAQVAENDWRVIFGNGPDSENGSATLILIDVFDGTTTTIEVDAGSANGLSAVLARDTNNDGFADSIYAGDLEGSLWKVTEFTGDAADAKIVKLFSAKDSFGNPQPITAAPLVGRDPDTLKTWVFFGTGKFLNEDDLNDTQEQSWYGIVDEDDEILLSEMVERTLSNPIDTKADDDESNDLDFLLRTLSAATDGDMDDKNGWYIRLTISKERIVVPNRFQGSALIGTTRIPDASDLCRPTGSGYILAINPFTGARLDQTFFDVNRDGKFDDDDKALLDDKSLELVSGIGIDSSPNNPIFIENVMQFSKDDGSTDSVRVQGSSAEARRASWREITNN